MTFLAAPVQSTDEMCSADSVSPPPKILASIVDYPGMLFAFRARAAERQIAISSDQANHVAGLSDNRLAQLLSLRTLHNIESVRRVGMLSLGPLLGVLGVKLVMVEDPKAMERHGTRIKSSNPNLAHGGGITHTVSYKFMQKIGKKGAKVRWAKHRKKIAQARKGGKMRWKNAPAAAAKSVQ